MLDFKRVLIPVDFSDFSRSTLERCQRILSGEYTDEIHFVYVWRPPPEQTSWTDPEAELNEMLDNFVSDFKPVGNAKIVKKVAVGHPATTIVDYADEHDMQLILIASHGRTGLKRMLLGSVAEQVARHAHCPVLVLREPRT
jgi:nucleotide-binding universal stress UspA family protein